MKRLLSILMALVISVLAIPTLVSATYTSTLTLENKNPTTWEIIPDGISGTLSYNSSGATFDFSFTATGLEHSTAYSLIYYANPWPGNFPGALIGTNTSGVDGSLAIAGNLNLNKNLPTPPDSNMLVPHNVPPDNYTHAYGAKIWLVPSACYDATLFKISVYSPTRFLFETDLITYTDTDLGGGSGIITTTIITEPTATIGLTISPPTLSFGSVAIGSCSGDNAITLTNTGNIPIRVTATTSAGFYTDCLKINDVMANGWVSAVIPASTSIIVQAKVCPTIAYSGTVIGSVSFVATFAP